MKNSGIAPTSPLPVFVTALILVAFTRVATAQAVFDVVMADASAAQGPDTVFFTPVAGAQLGLVTVEPFDTARPVLGAPYTADAVTDVTQALADGNRIEHHTSASIARDSRGRIRREHQATVIGAVVADRQVPLITISDPSTGTHLTLDQERRVAHRVRTGTFTRGSRIEFDVVTGPGLPGARAGAQRDTIRTEQLGTRDVEGVRADGTRTTVTIPIGAIGNQLPIDIVSERWYSPELDVVVRTRRSDPRFGETTYRLTNIVRAEPSPQLFTVPPDFTLEELSPPSR